MDGVNDSEFEWELLGLQNLEELHPLSYIIEPSFSVDGTDLYTLEARAKRTRSQNWSPDEKRAYLEAKIDALGTVKGKDWEFVSQRLWERHGFRRSAKECEYLWGTFRKDFRAIGRHEDLKGDHRTSKWVSYFEMNEPLRSKNKLLSLECYELIKTILEEQNKRSRSADPAGPSQAEYSGSAFHVIELEDDVDAQLFIEHRLESFIKGQVEDGLNSRFESLSCRKTCCGSTVEQDELLTSLAPLVKQRVEAAVIIDLKILALTGFVFDEEDSITALAPFVKKYIVDALNSALEPVSSALEALELKKLEAQKRRQAIEAKRKALDLEEMEIEKERQRVGRLIQRTKRASGSTQQGPRRRRSPPLGFVPERYSSLYL